MKKSLLALALFAFVGSVSAHEGHDKDGKKGKKEACSAEAKAHCAGGQASLGGVPSCCMKKGAKASATATPDTKAPATIPAVKSM